MRQRLGAARSVLSREHGVRGAGRGGAAGRVQLRASQRGSGAAPGVPLGAAHPPVCAPHTSACPAHRASRASHAPPCRPARRRRAAHGAQHPRAGPIPHALHRRHGPRSQGGRGHSGGERGPRAGARQRAVATPAQHAPWGLMWAKAAMEEEAAATAGTHPGETSLLSAWPSTQLVSARFSQRRRTARQTMGSGPRRWRSTCGAWTPSRRRGSQVGPGGAALWGHDLRQGCGQGRFHWPAQINS